MGWFCFEVAVSGASSEEELDDPEDEVELRSESESESDEMSEELSDGESFEFSSDSGCSSDISCSDGAVSALMWSSWSLNDGIDCSNSGFDGCDVGVNGF